MHKIQLYSHKNDNFDNHDYKQETRYDITQLECIISEDDDDDDMGN